MPDDGEYGPVSAGAAAAWKPSRLPGRRRSTTRSSPQDQRYLLGKDPLPDAFRNRGRAGVRESSRRPPRYRSSRSPRWSSGSACRSARKAPTGCPRSAASPPSSASRTGTRRWAGPWCAFTVFLAALKVGGQSAEAGLRQGKFNALFCPTILGEAQAGRWGMRVVAASQAARGDLVLFDWSPQGDPADHIGRLLRPPSAGVVATVDGNSGDESLAVVLRERPTSQVRAYVRDS